MGTFRLREDFRRDGLAANFLASARTIGNLARAIPGSIINIGYPGASHAEYLACKRIIEEVEDPAAELAVVGHACEGHLELLVDLAQRASNTSGNIWVPVSDRFIERTMRTGEANVLERARGLVNSWTRSSNHPIDVALADAMQEQDRERVGHWARELLDAGARRIILCDTLGEAEPSTVAGLYEGIGVRPEHLEFHPHDDHGFAIENAGAAVEQGVDYIGSAALRAGERRTMIDTIDLKERGALIDGEHYAAFLASYAQDIPDHQNILATVYGERTVVTGTQYRLRGRDPSLRLLFGVTSDRHITSLMSGNNGSITARVLDALKGELYENKIPWLDSEGLSQAVRRYVT
ncbi:MAG: hypothetical protein ACMXYM_04625 [Candidatus Woesearchaeota archaeon]